MKIIDTRGQVCPAPLIATKRALKESGKDDLFEVLTDSQSSLNNISRFLKDNSASFTVRESEGFWTLEVKKEVTGSSELNAEAYCINEVPHFSKGDFIVAFSSDTMGEGDRELGQILIVNFIRALKDLDVLPGKLIFYNSGVKLGSGDSPAAAYIGDLEKMGVMAFFCSTCVKYYSLEGNINAGTFSNMFELVQLMASTGNIIKP